jgi:hypothetical protein
MNSRFAVTLSPPSWGTSRRPPLGGLALIALWLALCAGFAGAVTTAAAPPHAGIAERR